MTLGKRKERSDKESEHHGSTLFVSNLPFNATSTDLQTLFSEIAPIRNAFVVTEHGTGVSKGIGYVSFSIREDATMAYDKITTEGITLVGRKLRVQWAEKKSNVSKEISEENGKHPTKKARPSSHTKADKLHHDPLAIRTIVISGLPESIDSKAIWKKVRKYEGAEKVEWPVVNKDSDEDNQDNSTAYAIFSTPSAAQDAVAKLHAHVFKGSLLSVTLKKRLDSLLASHHSHKPTAAAMPSYANRLIVRNLPFTATESDLRSVFLPYGPIYAINMPLNDLSSIANAYGTTSNDTKEEDDKQHVTVVTATAQTKAKNKGFAFVWYYYRKDAEHAMEKCNGMVLRAGTSEELVKGKQKKKKERRLEKKLALQVEDEVGIKEGEEDNESDEAKNKEKKDAKSDSKADKNERVIAVDWALSKDRWEEEKAKIEEELDRAQSEEVSSGSDSDSEFESDSDDDEGLGVHHEDDEGNSRASDEEEEEVEREDDEGNSRASDEEEEEEVEREDDKPVKAQLPQTDIGTTLFIRNVPYDATEDELRTLFRSFGPLRYARITLDPLTGRSRGTGFACFWNKEDADKVVHQSELLRAETTGGNDVATKKNPFTLPSILTPDPSSSLAQNLVLHGRALDVVRAVTRDEAERLKDEGERAREKTDKRNMYLLREGVILPNNPKSSSLSPAELERRTNSYNARRALLKSNPSLYISKTRLSVRQIPVYATDLMLKRLALHAARAFETEVKQGKRSGLSAAELEDQRKIQLEKEVEVEEVDEIHDASDAESERSGASAGTTLSKSGRRKAKLLQKLGQRQGAVKQAKIVRQADRVDPITGKGKSRGYGFVETYAHADALRVLRWANNNPDVPRLLRQWWKEELERLIKLERDKMKRKKDKGGEGKEEEEEAKARLKRMMNELEKEKQREKKKMTSGGGGKEADEDEKGDDRQSDRRMLIVEFSIENIQVVQRRNAIQKNKTAEHNFPETEGKKMLDDGQQLSKRTLPGHRSHNPTVRARKFESESHLSKSKGGKRAREKRDGKNSDERQYVSMERQQRPEKKRRRLSFVDSSESVPGIEKSKAEAEEPCKPGQKIGSIIGRKRKERREGKKR